MEDNNRQERVYSVEPENWLPVVQSMAPLISLARQGVPPRTGLQLLTTAPKHCFAVDPKRLPNIIAEEAHNA